MWQVFRGFYMKTWGHAMEQLVRNCTANRNVAGSIFDSVTWKFSLA
jgi:hypothetical protein